MAIHNLKIIVVDGGKKSSSSSSSSSSSNSEDTKTSGKNSPLYKALNLKQTIKNKIVDETGLTSSGVMILGMTSRLAKQVVSQTANYYISDIGRKTGDSNYQQLINRQIEIISDSSSLLTGALSGAAAGSMFGYGGAIAGAVVGFASSAVSLGFKYSERERTYQHEMFKESNSQTYSLARTSYQGFTGRLR